MHILLANDDGIGAVGIMALLEAAVERGHRVTMCAPSNQQSAASQRITLSEPIYVKDYPLPQPTAKGYAITGTPADCVRLAFLGGLLDRPADIVISGINNGYNAGMSTHYSGTVGAAMEGALNHVPAIAASIDYHADPENVREMAAFVIGVAERYREQSIPRATLLNINAPNLPARQWKAPIYAPLSSASCLDNYERRYAERAGVYYWLQSGCGTEEVEEGADLWYLARGHVVLTLMGNPLCHPAELFSSMGLLE